jgi:PAS domain S-box-containing protein
MDNVKRLTCAFGLLAILTGIAGIVGYISGIILISSICPGCTAIALIVALLWIFSGTVLVFLSCRPVRGAGEVATDTIRQVKAEEALREREQFLRETQKIAKIGGWKADPHTDDLLWTEGVYNIVEAPRTYRPTFSEGLNIFSREDQRIIRNRIENCLATGETFSLEAEITTQTGKKVWTEVRGRAPVTDVPRSVFIGTLQDITILRQIGERLKRENGKLDILAETARLLLSAEKPESIVQTVGERVMRYLHCHTFFNYLIDESGQRMRLNAYAGIPPGEAGRIEYLNLGEAVCGQVARNGERIVVSDVLNTDDERTCLIRSLGVSGYACHPLISQRRTLGTLSFGRCDRAPFTDEELDLMKAVTDLVATAMARKKIEDALRGTSHYLGNLFNYANAPIIVWDSSFRIQRFNHAFEFLTGMPADAVLGKPLEILFPEKTRQESMELIQKTSSGERWVSVEIPIRHVSGTTKIVLWNSANIHDTDGVTVSSTIAQGQDITGRKIAEDSAMKTASLLNAALDSTADGILVVDNAGNITSYNKTFCTIWGIPEHILDAAAEDAALAYMTPLVTDSPVFVSRLRELYTHAGRESFDMVTLKDGRIFERYSKPQMIGDAIVGRVWSYRDITERRQAEEALWESLEKFRIIATNIPDHIQVQDKELRYTQVINPLPGLTEKDMIGNTDYDMLSKEDADRLTTIKRQVLESGVPVYREMPLISASGEKNFFSGSYVPKRGAIGEIDGLIGYFRNVTETKEANEKIIAALAEKEILIREIHHRVKNNLQIISGLLDMTRMRTQDPATTGILTDMMMKIKTMAQIHTRLYESKQFDKINMGGQIRDQVADLSSIYGRSGPEISCEVETEDVLLTVDQAIPCALVVNESLSNAFKHAFMGRQYGTVTVVLRKENGTIRITISDDGIGIPENVDISRATSLGLKLMRSLVLQLQGTLTIESTDRGSVVNVEFPIREGG